MLYTNDKSVIIFRTLKAFELNKNLYFEINVINRTQNEKAIAIGLLHEVNETLFETYLGTKADVAPHYGDNLGYSSNGYIYAWQNVDMAFKDGLTYPYTTGDRVGVGYHAGFQAIFFTKNKQFLGFQLPSYMQNAFFAVCLASNGAEVEVNVGATPFYFTDFTVSLTDNIWRTIVDVVWCILPRAGTVYNNLKNWHTSFKITIEFAKALFTYGREKFVLSEHTWWLPILSRGISISEKRAQSMDVNTVDKTDPYCIMERCLRVIVWIINENYKIKSSRHNLVQITPEQDSEQYLALFSPISVHNNLLRSVS